MNQSLQPTIYPHYNAVFQNSPLKRHIAAHGHADWSLRLGSTTSNNAAALQGEPLLALCFGFARVLDQSLWCFVYVFWQISCSTQWLQELHIAGLRTRFAATSHASIGLWRNVHEGNRDMHCCLEERQSSDPNDWVSRPCHIRICIRIKTCRVTACITLAYWMYIECATHHLLFVVSQQHTPYWRMTPGCQIASLSRCRAGAVRFLGILAKFQSQQIRCLS